MKNKSLSNRILILFYIPTAVGLFKLVDTITNNEAFSVLLLCWLILIPIEKLGSFFAKINFERMINVSKIVLLVLTITICISVIIMDVLNVGNTEIKTIYPDVKYPFYFDNTFSGNARFSREFVSDYHGADKAVKLNFGRFPDRSGYGGWMIGFNSARLSSRIAKVLAKNTDFTDYKYLSFFIRGESGEEKMVIKIKDSSGFETGFALKNIPNKKWENYELNLRETFKGIDWSSIEVITFMANSSIVSLDNQSVYISGFSMW